MLKLGDLAARPDLRLGPVLVSPSRRRVEGPGGVLSIEPLIMQLLVLLLDARGKVVTRSELFDQLWGGTIVGDDSLNRAIGSVRKLLGHTAPGQFEIETIPRTGYRLTGEGIAEAEAQAPDGARPLTRRIAMGGLAAVAAGAGLLLWTRARPDPRATELVERGRRALRQASPEDDAQGVSLFRRAVAIEPDNAKAWGLLAVALRNVAESAPADRTTAAVADCAAAAQRALALNPREGNALAALAMLRPEFGEWGEAEDRLRHVLALEPDNITALNHLVMVLQSVGRARESWLLNERAATLEPLSPVQHYRRGLKQWIFGRIEQADRAIDRALQLWPHHPAVWSARLYIFAFTGRAAAGLAMIDDAAGRPLRFSREAADRWRASLTALADPSPAAVAAATRAILDTAPRSPGYAVSAIMILSELGQVDAAFDVADGFLLRRGPYIGSLWTSSGDMPVNDQYWRRTMNLFTPATAAMRADPRFAKLCDGMGMTDYWKRKGGPDAFLRNA